MHSLEKMRLWMTCPVLDAFVLIYSQRPVIPPALQQARYKAPAQ
jgi:hypothetical protein